ncbi:MAG TPA: hypothetical protein VGJ73_04700 [Verrucomicrobiae bacterium]
MKTWSFTKTWALCIGLIVLFAIATGRTESLDGYVTWNVIADPGNVSDLNNDNPINSAGSIPLRSGQVVTPSYSGRFIAVDPQIPGPKRFGEWWQVYDLKNLRPVGPDFPVPSNPGNGPILSPNGAYLAIRAKTQRGTIDIWDCKTGRLVRSLRVTDGLDDEYGFPADFVGANRLLTMCHPELFPLAGTYTHYQVWDLATGSEICHFDTDIIWGSKWATISPGGHYLVMARTGTHLYHLLAWDLTTGQSTGEVEFQGKNDPWGQACGLVFSPDARRLAIVWRLGQQDIWGRVLVFDVVQGRQVASFPLDYTMKSIGLGTDIGRPALQWTPDGNSWLILGHLLMDARAGTITGRIGAEPKFGAAWTVQQRNFVGANFVTDVVQQGLDRKLQYVPVPTKD